MNYIEWLTDLFDSPDSDVSLGHGPAHPVTPNLSLQKDVDLFFQKFPFLQTVPEYYNFQLVYAGIFIEEENYSISVYGFDEDVTIHLLNNPGDITNGDGMLFIADLVIDDPLETIAFAMKINLEENTDIVYRKKKPEDFKPFCSSREFFSWCAKSHEKLYL
jgi:hypothetical protein